MNVTASDDNPIDLTNTSSLLYGKKKKNSGKWPVEQLHYILQGNIHFTFGKYVATCYMVYLIKFCELNGLHKRQIYHTADLWKIQP